MVRRLWDQWHVERFDLTLETFRLHMTQVDVDWRLKALAGGAIDAQTLYVNTLDIRTLPSPKSVEPVQAPASVETGIDIYVQDLRVQQLTVGSFAKGEQGPLQYPKADVEISGIHARVASSGGSHRVDQIRAITPAGEVTGLLTMGTASPFTLEGQVHLSSKVELHAVEADAQVAGTLLLPHVMFKAESEGMKGHGDLFAQPFELMPLRGAQLEFKDVDPSLFNRALPHAQLSAKLDLKPGLPDGLKHEPTLADWIASGPLEVTNLAPATVDNNGIPVSSLTAQLDWASGRLLLNDLQILLPTGQGKASGIKAKNALHQGKITGIIKLFASKSGQTGHIEGALALKNVDPSQIAQAAQPMLVDGVVNATATEDMQQVKAKLKSDVFELEAQAEHKNNTVFLKTAKLSILKGGSQGLAELSGQLGLKGDQAFSLNGRTVKIDPNVFAKSAPQGTINAEFGITGHIAPVWLAKLNLSLTNSFLAGKALEGKAKIDVSAQSIANADINLNILENRIKLTGGYGKAGDQLKYNIDAPYLGRLGGDFSGTASLDGTLSGTMGRFTGGLTAKVRGLKVPGDISIDALDAQANMQDGINGLVQVDLDLKNLRMGTEEKIGKDGKKQMLPKDPIVRSASFKMDGRRKSHTATISIEALKNQHIEMSGAGGWLDDQRWKGMLQTLKATGPVAFELLKPATLEAATDHFTLGSAQLKAQNGDVFLERTEWSLDHIAAKGHITGVQMGLSLDKQRRTVAGGRTLSLGGEWDINFGQEVEGLIRIYREGGDLVLQGDVPVAMGLETFETSIAASNNRLTLNTIVQGKRIGHINIVASAATLGKGSSVRLNPEAQLVGVANISMPSIDWMGPFINQNLQLAGSLNGNFHILGTPAHPQGAGTVSGKALEVGMADQGFHLTEGDVQVSFDAAQVLLEKFAFTSANTMVPPDGRLRVLNLTGKKGSLTGSGDLQLTTGKGTFHLKADKVGVLQQKNQWMLASGTADIDSGWESFNLTAAIKADAGYIGVPKDSAPSLSSDVIVRGTKVKEPSDMKLNADITFDMGNNFILKAYGIDTYLDGALKLSIAQGDMKGKGTIQTRGGVFDAYGRKLTIERGMATFQGPIDNPSLNVMALRKGLAVEAGVEVTGLAQSPRIRLVSEPNVPETEKLSWIISGHANESGSADAGLLFSAANAILGGGGSDSGIVNRVAGGLGFDDVSIGDETTGSAGAQSQVARNATGLGSSVGSQGVTGDQVVSLGKRLTSKLYLALEQNFSGTESVAKLSYSLTRFISVIAQVGTDNAIDFSYSISFR